MAPGERSWVPPLLSARTVLSILECVWTGVGTHAALSAYANRDCYEEENQRRLLELVINLVIFNWALLLITLCFFISWLDISKYTYGLIRGLLLLVITGSTTESLDDVAKLFAKFFEDWDMVPSDIAAGLFLVRLEQKVRRQKLRQQRAMAQQTGQPMIEVVGHRRSSSAPNFLSEVDALATAIYYYRYAYAIYGWAMYLFYQPLEGPTQVLWRQMSSLLQMGIHFFRAMCENPFSPKVKERKSLALLGPNTQAALHRAQMDASDLVYVKWSSSVCEPPYMICLDKEKRAVVLSVRGSFSVEDWLGNFLCEPVSLQSFGERYGFDGLGHFAHSGTCTTAHNILQDLEGHRALDVMLHLGGGLPADIVNSEGVAMNSPSRPQGSTVHSSPKSASSAWTPLGAFRSTKTEAGQEGRLAMNSLPDCTGWQLVIVGHSIGGGVAALLGHALRQKFQPLKVIAYSPPGATVSLELATLMKEHTLSLVVDKDFVSRLSIATVERLRDSMIDCVSRCKVNKFWLSVYVLRAALFGMSSVEHLANILMHKPGEELREEPGRLLASYKRRTSDQGSLEPVNLYPPGNLLYLQRQKQAKESSSSTSGAQCKLLPSPFGLCCPRAKTYTADWTSQEAIIDEGVLVSKSMVVRHFPFLLPTILDSTAQAFDIQETVVRPTDTKPVHEHSTAPFHRDDYPADQPDQDDRPPLHQRPDIEAGVMSTTTSGSVQHRRSSSTSNPLLRFFGSDGARRALQMPFEFVAVDPSGWQVRIRRTSDHDVNYTWAGALQYQGQCTSRILSCVLKLL
eukprot:scaffold873_cov393-Prasinococcus_capsulatus_cf.AAC.13